MKIKITQIYKGQINQYLLPLDQNNLLELMQIKRIGVDVCKVRMKSLKVESTFVFDCEADAELFCEHFKNLCYEKKQVIK